MASLYDELKQLQKKMESKLENDDLRKSVDFLSEEYDDIRSKKRSTDKDFNRFERKLETFTKKVEEIGEAIESIMKSTNITKKHGYC